MKTVLILLMTSITISSYSQVDSVKVYKVVDNLEDTYFYAANRKMVISNPEMTKGVSFDPYITNDWKLKFLSCQLIGLGGCNEKDELILLFENEEKIKTYSWKKFNCEGKAYFNISKSDYNLLKNHKLVKARVTNGRNFKSITENIKEKNQSYFIQLIKELEAEKFYEAEK